ncbi:hypothetical protein BDZ45DRAFT_676164 [Acephala macrosclerotiorum]|nr:hypothetical protein BDZ45DRAFT_676164 [Acephala macrosclerotiorum]
MVLSTSRSPRLRFLKPFTTTNEQSHSHHTATARMQLQELVAVMASSRQESSFSQSQSTDLVQQIQGLKILPSPLLKLAEEILHLIFDQVFLKYGICAATCFGLGNKQLYTIFKSYHPNPVHLSAREYDIEKNHHVTPFLAERLQDFMAPLYRPGILRDYRYLPVDKYGTEPGSQEEMGLYKWYDDYLRGKGHCMVLGAERKSKVVLLGRTSTKIGWDVEEARIVKEILLRQ